MNLYIVKVGQALRATAVGALRRAFLPLTIENQGYVDGSTSWLLIIRVGRGVSERHVRSCLWGAGISWVNVRKPTQAELDAEQVQG